MSKGYFKHCPKLDSKFESQMIQTCKFHFDEEFYKKFQKFMIENPGKTTKELCSLIKFYKFTPKTLSTAFKMFNSRKETFYNICGPFIYKDNRWFPVYGKKYTDTVIITKENNYLRSQIQLLRLQIELLNKSN